jgi:hypothetical protein
LPVFLGCTATILQKAAPVFPEPFISVSDLLSDALSAPEKGHIWQRYCGGSGTGITCGVAGKMRPVKKALVTRSAGL